MTPGTFAAAAASALAVALPCSAQDVGLHLVSRHERAGYENGNVGAYVRMPSGLTLGALRNSEGRFSTYAGWTWETSDKRFALTAGAITGYKDRPASPLLVPSYRHQITESMSARVAYIPKPRNAGGSSAVHLALEWSLQ